MFLPPELKAYFKEEKKEEEGIQFKVASDGEMDKTDSDEDGSQVRQSLGRKGLIAKPYVEET